VLRMGLRSCREAPGSDKLLFAGSKVVRAGSTARAAQRRPPASRRPGDRVSARSWARRRPDRPVEPAIQITPQGGRRWPRSARRRPSAPALRRIEVDGVAVEDCAAAAFL